jgi:hypothetical protein
MSEFQIEIEDAAWHRQDADAPRGISVRANNIVLTQLL